MMDKKEIAMFFDSLAFCWDEDQSLKKDVISFIFEKGGIKKDRHILDVACGTGVLFPEYLRHGVKVTAIDISPLMTEKAREKFPSVKVICGDAEEYIFEEKFDGVMIYNAFPHFADSEKLFKNLSSALKEKGRLTVAHGMSERELEECHSGAAKNVSLPLPSKEKLALMMSPYFEVDVKVSDEKMYIVSGIKK